MIEKLIFKGHFILKECQAYISYRYVCFSSFCFGKLVHPSFFILCVFFILQFIVGEENITNCDSDDRSFWRNAALSTLCTVLLYGALRSLINPVTSFSPDDYRVSLAELNNSHIFSALSKENYFLHSAQERKLVEDLEMFVSIICNDSYAVELNPGYVISSDSSSDPLPDFLKFMDQKRPIKSKENYVLAEQFLMDLIINCEQYDHRHPLNGFQVQKLEHFVRWIEEISRNNPRFKDIISQLEILMQR